MSFALKAIFEALHRSGAAAALRPWSQGLGVIFCMHHVLPAKARGGFAPNANLESTPEFLDAVLSMLEIAGYEFLSLDAVAGRLTRGEGGKKPFAVFTLDDGYRDNFVHALPVFAKHDCPFAVYVTPGLVDGTTEMWWRALEAIIANHGVSTLDVLGEAIHLNTKNNSGKWAAWKKLLPLVQGMPEYEQRDWIRKNCARLGIDLKRMCSDVMMTWDELRQLSTHPLASIGAHTNNHFAVSRLSEADARREIADSGRRIARELGKPVTHFAFPYGNVAHAGPRDFALCREAGYLTAVTTRLGTVFPEHKDHLYALPRVMVSSKFDQTRWLKVLASGLPGLLNNRGRRLNVT